MARKFAGIENLRDLPMVVTQDHGFSGNRLKLSDQPIRKGDLALAFDILLGDALFVDRMSYNFVSPKSGILWSFEPVASMTSTGKWVLR